MKIFERDISTSVIVCQLLFLCACLTGCSHDDGSVEDVLPKGDFLELEKRLEKVDSGESKLIEEMAPDDIIVVVNGYPLTKRYYNAVWVTIFKNMMAKRGASQHEAMKRIEEMQPKYINQFVMRRLLLDDARRQKVISDEDLRRLVGEKIQIVANATKKKPKEVVARFGDTSPVVFYDIAEHILMDALIRAKIPPAVKVDDDFVAATQAQVTADNEATRKTNELIRVKLMDWKKDIDTGKATFENVVSVRTNDHLHVIDKGGEWGTYEKSNIKDRALANAAFSLPIGGISEPIEEEEGFSLLKVLAITPAETNAKGRTIQHEARKLARIYVEKEPLLIRQSDEEMFKDLKQQMQLQAIYKYADNLRTNGLNTVVYPHGERLFK